VEALDPFGGGGGGGGGKGGAGIWGRECNGTLGFLSVSDHLIEPKMKGKTPINPQKRSKKGKIVTAKKKKKSMGREGRTARGTGDRTMHGNVIFPNSSHLLRLLLAC
jgi:hypothetical protein